MNKKVQINLATENKYRLQFHFSCRKHAGNILHWYKTNDPFPTVFVTLIRTYEKKQFSGVHSDERLQPKDQGLTQSPPRYSAGVGREDVYKDFLEDNC